MIRNQDDLSKLKTRLDEVRSSKPDYDERFRFFGSVLDLVFERRVQSKERPVRLSSEDAAARLGEGFPLLDRPRLEPDAREARRTLEALEELVRSGASVPAEAFDEADRHLAAAGFAAVLSGFFREGALGREAEALSKEASELLFFLLFNSLRPWHEMQSAALEKTTGLADWEEGYCPICGGLPAMEALVGEEGQRRLLCHRCGFTWGFQRVRCPFCANRDHEKLRYMSFETEPAMRIYICNQCRGYLKGVDSRKFAGEIVLEAEDLVTPHYDLIARREGYVKKTPNILGLNE